MHPWEVLIWLPGPQGLKPGAGELYVCRRGQAGLLLISQSPPHPYTFATLFRHLPDASAVLGTKIQQLTDTVPPGSSFQLVQGTQNLAVKSTAVP